jgi:CheY-like chemotaxis protein
MTRILVVDDEAALVRMLARALRRHGFEVDTATSGATALDLVVARVPDAIISDVRMSSVDGPTLLKELRARGVFVPVVFLTGYASHHSEDELTTLGASAVLGKPVEIGALIDALAGARIQAKPAP